MEIKNKITLSNYRKRKTSIALLLKIIIISSVTLFYLISSKLTVKENDEVINNNNNNNELNYNKQRKLLSIINNNDNDNNVINTTSSISEQQKILLINNRTENLINETMFIKNCTLAAILDFPSDKLTRKEREDGWIFVHCLLACYCFWLLAIVCDNYFVPSIEMLCKKLKMKEDVAGATFMAAATSSPELFINCVGTFITEGDIGVGTIVGSAVFNILAVPACCGLLCGQIINLEWWPVSRDSFMYGVSVLALIGTLNDGIIMWYEALFLVLAYILYIIIMYYNDIISEKIHALVIKLRRKQTNGIYREVSEITALLSKDKNVTLKNGLNEDIETQTIIKDDNSEEIFIAFADNPWCKNDNDNYFKFLLRWPITFLLWFTIPDCRKYPKIHLITFFVCIIWIAIVSYLVAFLITIVGDTVNIPDSVMGLTLLAAGTSVPEAVSSIIVTNQGHGSMGISNSIGSNTFDILLCLGLPWLIKSTLLPVVPGNAWVTLNSSGLTYSAISLLSTLFGLYFAFIINKFRLDWKIGLTCTIMYIAFLIFASLVELNIFFSVNIPTCLH